MTALFRRPSLYRGPAMVPTYPVEIDWEHPLGAALVGAYIPGSPRGFTDISGIGPNLVPRGGAAGTFAGTACGPGYYAPSTGALLSSSAFPSAWQFTQQFSLFYLGYQNGTAGPNNAFLGADYTGNVAPYLTWGLINAGGFLQFFYSNGVSYSQPPGAAIGTGRVTLGVSAIIGGAIRIYQQGTQSGSATWSGGAPNYTSPAMPFLAFASDTSSRGANGTGLAGYIYGAAMSASDFAWLDAEPFAMLRPAVRRKWFLVSSGGNVYNETISESASAIDNYTPALIANAALSESASASDAITASAAFNATLAETASASDAMAAILQAVVAYSESASAADALAVAVALNAALNEAASASDALAVANVITEALVEAGAATDVMAAEATFVAALTEAANATDNYSVPGENTFVQLVAARANVPRTPHGFV